MSFRHLTIVGLGLIGGSIGLAARDRLNNCEITGYDTSPSARRAALRRGAVHRVSTRVDEACREASLVLLAVPAKVIGPVLCQVGQAVPSGAVITDVCSVKQAVIGAAGRLPRSVRARFVPGHPMFGSQHTGIEHADAALLDPVTRCWLTPTRMTDRAATLAVRRFWTSLGLKVGTMTPAEHDRRLARASHLVQVVASALAAVQTGDSISAAGRGLLDTTRLAGSDPDLWTDVLMANRASVSTELKRLIAELAGVADALDRGQPGPARSLLRRGNSARRAIVRRFAVRS